jgi:eukaryotic-like serine/threonine-protein kinase
MDPERWGKIERIFHQALDADEAQRAAVLQDSCAGDESLRREIESLLRHYERAGSFVGAPAFSDTDDATSVVARNPVGTTVGQYRILEPIGAGGMGVVSKGEDTRLGRLVALKFLPENRASDPTAMERFRREARAASALNHPNICTIYDIQDCPTGPFIVMEYIEGPTIAERINGRPLPLEDLAKIGMQVAEGLAAAHAKGIVHRDIKPGNIIVTSSGLVKVLDFGLAKLLNPDSDSVPTFAMTQTGAVTGTVPYMSPEQLRGRDVDSRTDIYSLGVVLYEMATGRRPFETSVVPVLIDNILNSPPPPPRQRCPKLPEALDQIILKCLEKDPEDRYQGAKEIAVDLRRMIAPSSHTTLRDVKTAPKRAHVVRWTAAALVLAAIMVAAVVLYVRPRSHSSARQPWVQLTDFPDSATSPALSPDGRMLAFIRGPSTFVGPGDVCLKLLPSGEPLQLTSDGRGKQDPLFSPDGSRVMYTTGPLPYDLWYVPVTGGKPQLMMRNAGTLTWTPEGRVMFAEIRGAAQMAIVTATETRSDARDVYVPSRVSGMAHRAYLSPDGKWVLVAEMDTSGIGWMPCRLVPFDGSSPGRPIGPRSAPCTSAAWSPDGKWMYLSSAAGGAYHIWRQRFPDGVPEQVTFGPTQEEGIAMAPDGRSLITSVGGAQSSLWLRDRKTERQIDTEAAADDPRFSSDGSKLFYVVRKQLRAPDQQSGELWTLDVASGNRERLLPGYRIHEYDVSADGDYVAVSAFDDRGQLNLWIAPLDRHAAPRKIDWTGPITSARFDPAGGMFVNAGEGDKQIVYHVALDGTNRRPVTTGHLNELIQVSPAGKWILVRAPLPGGDVPRIGILAYPVHGGDPVVVSKQVWLNAGWSSDGKFFEILSEQPGKSGPTVASIMLPLRNGTDLPALPPGGLDSSQEAAALRGAKIVQHDLASNDVAGLAAAPHGSTLAYIRTVVHRNLYRIPLPD